MSVLSPRGLFLFDIDGTLLRGARFQHRDALLAGVERVTGLRTSFDGIDTAGRLDRDLIRALMDRAGYDGPLTRELMAEICDACQGCYLGGSVHDLSHCICPGVLPFLERARAGGLVLGNVTGNLRAIARRKLERAGLAAFFTLGGFAEDGHTRAELARMAADEARDSHGIDDWAPVILIGDHLNDVEAARTNGFLSIAVATGVIPLEQLAAAEPTMAVPDLTGVDPVALVDLYRGRN